MAYCTVDELAAALHVAVTPANTEALQRAVDAAAAEIDHDLDRAGDPLPDPPPAAIVAANVALGVETFKLADSAFGVLGFDDMGVVRATKDSLPRYWQLLTPYKVGWGLA